MFDLAIVGCGPRGLAVLLRAVLKYPRLRVIVIDPNPLSTWSSDYLLSDITMRSPASFDLVTYQKDMQDYSLIKFLDLEPVHNLQSQIEVEDYNYFCSRAEFKLYLDNIYEEVSNSFTYCDGVVSNIEEGQIHLFNRQNIKAKNIVVATGNLKPKVPLWVEKTKLKRKVEIAGNIDTTSVGKEVVVIGSGQGAAEYAEFFSRNNNVTWIYKHAFKAYQYPLPDYKKWRIRSGLSDYYRRIISDNEKSRYLQKIKLWQPTVTHNIYYKVINNDNITRVKEVKPSQYIDTADQCILQAGYEADCKYLPIKDVTRSRFSTNFPEVKEGFKLSLDRVYITGPLALYYDGPRQNSLISCGLTAKEILENI